MQQGYLRAALVGLGGILIIVAAGLILRLPWATSIWPWTDSWLPYIYLGAFAAAAAASLLWIGLSGELGATLGGVLDMGVVFTALAIALVLLSSQDSDIRLGQVAIVCLIGVGISLALWFWFRRYPIRDTHPLPPLVRISFVAFVVILLGAGIANLLQLPYSYPWELRPTTYVLVGSIFLGSAFYFLYSLLNPVWRNAYAQLWGFLAYDIVLIVPLLVHFGTVGPSLLPSLTFYVLVLLYSGAIAVYYLLINRATRTWSLPNATNPPSTVPAP